MTVPTTGCWSLAAVVLCALCGTSAPAQGPLHQRIDQALASATPDFKKKAAPPATDAEFLRRVYLDLTGTIPAATETRAFLADKSPAKRQILVDKLLASPEHARHMAHVFDVVLMERRADKHVPRAVWLEYLRTAFAANRPWDELARELLSADGSDPARRAPAKFILDRDAEPHLLTRDVSRLFLGMNYQCAQCHDSPIVDDYKQDLYYGLFAFLNRTSVFVDPKTKLAVLAEKADGEVSFQSVFDKAKVTRTSGPRVPGRALIKEAMPEKGNEYKVKPAKDVRPIPTVSRFALLGGEVARTDNVAFKRNIANRLWAQMMGRGLVHPLDMDHSDNPPSHPALLTLLAEEMAAGKFDMRKLLRELALSEAYQRTSELPPGSKGADATFAGAHLKPLTPEALAFSLYQATGMTDSERLALAKTLNEATLYTRVAAAVTPLITTFRGQPGTTQEFEPTLDQALFLTNGGTLRAWLTPRTGNLLDRVSKLQDNGAIAEELYLSILTRLPTADERKDVNDYLTKAGPQRSTALNDYAWALLTSAEFRFNH